MSQVMASQEQGITEKLEYSVEDMEIQTWRLSENPVVVTFTGL